MYPSLMGKFNIAAPIIDIIYTPSSDSSPLSSVPFRTMYLDDPWTLPSLSTSDEDVRTTRIEILLFAAEVAYQAILDPVVDPGPSSS